MIAVLHNIRSAHNVGSIFRTADAAGIDKIYLTGFTPSPINRIGNSRNQLTKVSLGAEKFVNWESNKSVENVLSKLKKDGFNIIAVEQVKNSTPYNKIEPLTYEINKLVIVVGNEVEGLPQTVLNTVDNTVEIPMFGNKKSLNVSVAFGIIAYYFAMMKV